MAVSRRVLRASSTISVDDSIVKEVITRDSVAKELLWLCKGFDRNKIKYYSIFRYVEFIYGDSFNPADLDKIDLNLMLRLIKVLRRIRNRNKKEGVVRISGVSDRTRSDLTSKGIVVDIYSPVLDVVKLKSFVSNKNDITILRNGFKNLTEKEIEYIEFSQLELLLSSLLFRLFNFEESMTISLIRSVNEDFIGFMLVES